MSRQRLVVGNWKMNGTIEDSLKKLTELHHKLPKTVSAEVAVAPPFTALYSASVVLQETPIKLAAQNMHWENKGAFTGEVSGAFLKEIGCAFVILGHSERRHLFSETDEMINKKIESALSMELKPIFCLGETLTQREAGKTEDVLESQVKKGLQGIPMNDLKDIVIAYEPVWAIGTGKTAKTDEIASASHFIRNQVAKVYDAPTAEAIRLLYGGSVTPDNAAEIFSVSDVDGVLVGGASLEMDKFLSILSAG